MRALLEFQTSICAQFWTLTFSDDGLRNLEDEGPRLLLRRFTRALQERERRAGTGLKVRCFGALEYGDTTQRPHFHLILYNHLKSVMQATPYIPNSPRPRMHTALWRHGHVDVQDFSAESARYVAKYCMKFEEGDDDPVSFFPRKPPLGLHGLWQHVERISKGPRARTTQTSMIEIDGRRWQLPPSFALEFRSACRWYGVPHEPPKTKSDFALDRMADDLTPPHLLEAELRKANTRERLYLATATRKLHKTLDLIRRMS